MTADKQLPPLLQSNHCQGYYDEPAKCIPTVSSICDSEQDRNPSLAEISHISINGNADQVRRFCFVSAGI
jgi:hypothetical protein